MKTRINIVLTFILTISLSGVLHAQLRGASPLADKSILLEPDPADWLMFSRTYDNQRFSPLDQINQENVGQLDLVWARGMYEGSTQEFIPLVYQGIMLIANPGGIIQALNATNGDLLWEYRRPLPDDIEEYIGIERVRTLAIRGDQVFYASPDGYVLALDVETGELHWESLAHDYRAAGTTEHTTGPMVAETSAGGRVMTGRNCRVDPEARSTCFIIAHDADTGQELWRFHTPAGDGEPGSDTWANMPDGFRQCSPWGMPAAFDPERNLVYWGVANPSPHTRYKRHAGDPFAVSLSTPSELYCNSTLALNADTGELEWYYQHLPGDDWDSDWVQERVLLESPFNPDPDAVKWFNPTITRGEMRDMVVTVGEPGGLSVLDRTTGQFLWAIPFPFDTPYFHISDIDGQTGIVHISPETVLTGPDQEHIICYGDTKNYYPMAYHPERNALYIPYHDVCYKRTAALGISNGHIRELVFRPGSDPEAWAGIAKVNMETGRVDLLHTQDLPASGAVLATAGDLIFWGDMNRRFRAFDAGSGEILWETIVGGIVQNSTITYSVGGKQYIAILTGDGGSSTVRKLALVPEFKPARGHNSVYVFALPD